ncbi:MAG: glutamate racemase [Candidatus Sericytochromatia bacterium]|nr:glutamate racemase [Candidatus Sericytochromatia bacterium]
MITTAPIALYDSGLGGLTVYKALREALPNESLLYFGDTARVPYGPRPSSEIVGFNVEIVSWLLAQGAKYVVIACNTSSAMALPVLKHRFDVPIRGLIESGAKQAATVAGQGHIGVIATEGTVRSAAYQESLARHAAGAQVSAVACPTLVPLIESGDWSSDQAVDTVAKALVAYTKSPPDALVLGCTHYPHVKDIIQRLLPKTTLIDPAIPLAGDVASDIVSLGCSAPLNHAPFHHVAVSGCPEHFFAQADRLLPQQIKSVAQIAFEPTPPALAPCDGLAPDRHAH